MADTVISTSTHATSGSGSNTAAGSVGSSDSGHAGPHVAGVHSHVSSLYHHGSSPRTRSFTVGPTVVIPGPSSGPLASCPCGDHSVTAISGPGETTCSPSCNSIDSIGGLNGTSNTEKLMPPGSIPECKVVEGS